MEGKNFAGEAPPPLVSGLLLSAVPHFFFSIAPLLKTHGS